jgi:hypothetical protein
LLAGLTRMMTLGAKSRMSAQNFENSVGLKKFE